MTTITDDLAKAVTEGFRQAQIDIANQDKLLVGPGDVTLIRPDGSTLTGPSWPKLITAANAAGVSAAAAATSATNAKTSKTAAASSETNALASKNAAKTSETNAKTSENNAKTSETNAATSLAAAQVLTSVPYEDAPYPDVWAPLSDDLRLLAGSAPYDKLTISGQVLELPTKSMTLTRATTAAYTDKTGLMRLTDIDEPRFEKQGLLTESAATNLYLYSETYTAGQNVTVTQNASTSPMGDLTMTLIKETTTNAEHYVGDRNIALTAGTVYCFSIYVKAGQGNRWLYMRVASGTTANTFFDVTNGQWGNTSAAAPVIERGYEDVGGGIYRVWFSFTAAATQATVIRIQLSQPNQVSTYAGDGASGLYIWGGQFEEGVNPTSYIKTNSSAVTRAADLWKITKDNTGYRNLAEQFNRTVAFELLIKSAPASNYTEIFRCSGVSNDISCRLTSNRLNAYRGSGGPTLTFDKNVPGVYVHTTNGDSLAIYYQGRTSPATSTPVSTAQVPVEIGNGGQSVAKYVCYIRNIRIWHRVLTPNQINGLR